MSTFTVPPFFYQHGRAPRSTVVTCDGAEMIAWGPCTALLNLKMFSEKICASTGSFSLGGSRFTKEEDNDDE